MSLEGFVLRMPKVELHVHLEGTMRPALLLELARRNRVELPASDEAGLKRWFRYRDFAHFVEVYLTCSRALRAPEDFHLLARDFLAEQAMQSVVYSEVHFTISTHLAAGGDGEGIREALEEAVRDAERRLGVTARWIPDIVRNMDQGRADRTVEWAVAGRGRGVVAMGLAGIEAGYAAAPFRRHFEEVRRVGLHGVAHAGEQAGPESVRETLDACEPERIGHGVRAIEDQALVAELARRGLPLEVCPGSNVRLGIYPSLAAHPFDRLRASGVAVSVNTDDPPFFGTNLTREYLDLARTFGYGAGDLAGISLAGLRHSFLPAEEKVAREAEFRRRFAELGERLLGGPVEPAAA